MRSPRPRPFIWGSNMMTRALKLAGCLAVIGLVTASAATASTVLGLTVEDQARLATWVVAGEVTGLQGVDHPENGLETAVTLRVERSFKGKVMSGDELVFHTRSGELDGERSIAIGEAEFNVGAKVLVFVESIDGRAYNIGLSYGVFNVLEDRRGRRAAVRALQDGLEIYDDAGVGNGPFTLEEIAARVNHAARNPRFDNEM